MVIAAVRPTRKLSVICVGQDSARAAATAATVQHDHAKTYGTSGFWASSQNARLATGAENTINPIVPAIG